MTPAPFRLKPAPSNPVRHRSLLALLLLVFALALPLAGCGKKALPEPPAGSKVTFPSQYPKE